MRKKQEIHGISKEELVKEKLSKVPPIVAKKLTVRALSVTSEVVENNGVLEPQTQNIESNHSHISE